MTVAVVGRGAMGSRIAARLRDAGHTVVTRAELSSADVAIVMVPDAAALRGIAAELAAAPAVIVMATVGREAVAELRSALPGPVVDAPVLGSIAEDAELIAEAAPGLPLADAVRRWFAASEQSGRGDEDYTAVLAEILERGA